MQWSDDAIVLTVRSHGEHGAIASLLTREHGRHAGLLRDGRAKATRGTMQTGNRVAAQWSARLGEHLGTWRCELLRAHAADILGDPLALAALGALAAVAEATLPERERHAPLFATTAALIEAFAAPGWPAAYVQWELALLAELGYGLDLARCALTGTVDDLAFVSPRTGRAVSTAAAEPWRDRLIALPRFLAAGGSAAPTPSDIAAGLALTGHFVERHLLVPQGRRLPAARDRFVDEVRRLASLSAGMTDAP
ncbi:MAG: DNA repair protein RecO [Alphaproteobacteria bacterium]|nr:DNA repair protein RecO [Alphaproteobacteria bacterium]